MTCTDTSSPTRRGGPGVCRGFDRADVAADHHGHVAGADVFLAHKDDVGRLHHRVGRLDRPNETLGLDHSQGLEWHAAELYQKPGRGGTGSVRLAAADADASSRDHNARSLCGEWVYSG